MARKVLHFLVLMYVNYRGIFHAEDLHFNLCTEKFAFCQPPRPKSLKEEKPARKNSKWRTANSERRTVNVERRMAHKIMAKMRSYSDAICTRHRWEWVHACVRALGHFITPVPSGHAPALQRKLLEIYLFIGQVRILQLPAKEESEGPLAIKTATWPVS